MKHMKHMAHLTHLKRGNADSRRGGGEGVVGGCIGEGVEGTEVIAGSAVRENEGGKIWSDDGEEPIDTALAPSQPKTPKTAVSDESIKLSLCHNRLMILNAHNALLLLSHCYFFAIWSGYFRAHVVSKRAVPSTSIWGSLIST